MGSLVKLFFIVSIASATPTKRDLCPQGIGYCVGKLLDVNVVKSTMNDHTNVFHRFCDITKKVEKCIQNPVFGCLEDNSFRKMFFELKLYFQKVCEFNNSQQINAEIYSCLPIFGRCIFQQPWILQEQLSIASVCKVIPIVNCLEKANNSKCNFVLATGPISKLVEQLEKHCSQTSTPEEAGTPESVTAKPLIKPTILFKKLSDE